MDYQDNPFIGVARGEKTKIIQCLKVKNCLAKKRLLQGKEVKELKFYLSILDRNISLRTEYKRRITGIHKRLYGVG